MQSQLLGAIIQQKSRGNTSELCVPGLKVFQARRALMFEVGTQASKAHQEATHSLAKVLQLCKHLPHCCARSSVSVCGAAALTYYGAG